MAIRGKIKERRAVLAPRARFNGAPDAIQLFYIGREFYPVLAEQLGAAQTEILLNTYSFDFDSVGQQVVAILRARAAAGVRVRLIFDALESSERGAPVLRALTDSGVEVRAYRPLGYAWRRPASFLYRDHARLFLIDRKILGLGGMSIGEIYNDRIDLFGFMPVSQPAPLLNFFEQLWQASLKPAVSQLTAEPAQIFPGRRILISGPAPAEQQIYAWWLKTVRAARREVVIVTSFFFPTREMAGELIAARRRGARVVIVTPGATDKNRYDNFRSIPIAPLLTQGILWYATPFYFHAKFILVDQAWSFGSSNCDIISLKRNYELDVTGRGGETLAGLKAGLARLTAGQTPRRTQPKTWFFGWFSHILYWLFEFFFTANG